jgi:hypothetical protein
LYLNHKEEFQKVFDVNIRIFLDGLTNVFKESNDNDCKYSVNFDEFINYLIYELRNQGFEKNNNEMYIKLYSVTLGIIFSLYLGNLGNRQEHSEKQKIFINIVNKKVSEYCPIINELEKAINRKSELFIELLLNFYLYPLQ